MILVGPKRDDGGSSIIRPAFHAGHVSVRQPNRAPVFAALPNQYVMEGNLLDLLITVNDPDADNVTLAVTGKPSGAMFVDNGDGAGRLTWTPQFVGPQSADGSPFTVSLWASDGAFSTERTVAVHVVNVNRAPVITAPPGGHGRGRPPRRIRPERLDPDFRDRYLADRILPTGASFIANNPRVFAWQSRISDSGAQTIRCIAVDPEGLADTADVGATINPVALYHLTLDSVQVFPGELFDLSVRLDNKFPVSSFNVLFNYDPSVFSLLSTTNTGTRSEDFEYFHVQLNDKGLSGNIRMTGLANNGGGTAPLAAGDGPLALCRFQATNDISYEGMSLPVRFRFSDAPVNADNTLGDSLTAGIEQTAITYTHGEIQIHDIGQIKIGDINLNGLAAEIGDVIYFTNYFINPWVYQFNLLQYANSDINRDNIAATISDLVALINIVVNGGTIPSKSGGADAAATIATELVRNAVVIRCESEVTIGAALLVIESDQARSDRLTVRSLQSQMTLDYHVSDGRLSILLYSLTGGVIADGRTELVAIEGIEDCRISTIDLGSAEGQLMLSTLQTGAGSLPTTYALDQNYPNPFNPETRIDFSLPLAGDVELTVFNMLGQQVRRLVSGPLPAGRHSILWDGADSQHQPVASGVYLYRLQAGGQVFNRKMMLLK